MNRSERESLIAVARGDQLADVVLRGGEDFERLYG